MKTTSNFIKQAKAVHGNKYDYSKTEYCGYSNKVRIICPIHGDFWQKPNNHLNGQGCPICGKIHSKNKQTHTTEGFIEKAKAVHGDKYDYSKVEYINNKTKVCIICPKHGEFWQVPTNHLNGQGCHECSIDKQRMTKEEFVEKAREVHGDKYDYSKVEFKKNKDKICIICPEHGEFWQKLNNHLNGATCNKCAKKIIKEKLIKLTKEEFIEKAREVHGDKYDYSKVEYKGVDKKIHIVCPIHGSFWQTPYAHLNGQGCSKCNESHLEREIRMMLEKNNIFYVYRERKINWLKGLELDFYLPQYNIGIECQGEQHFLPNNFFGGVKEYNKRKVNDNKKKELCEKNGITLLYYTNFLCEESKDMFFDTNEIIKMING